MEEIKLIDKTELNNLVLDESTGKYIVPDGIKIFRDNTTEQILDYYKSKLAELTIEKPTDEELIMEGKEIHPYFQQEREREEILNKIKELGV